MMLSNITIKKILHNILLGILVFLFLPFYSEAQVSTEALHIGEVVEFNAYSAFVSGNTPGMCLLATFYSVTPTNVRARTAPYSTIDNPVWTYGVHVPGVGPLETAIDMSIGSNLQPATKYIVQFVEVASDGTYHIITPQNQTDDITTICTPNADGTSNSSCQPSTPVVSNCSPAGVNQALQASGENILGTASIENISPNQNGVSFVVDTSNLDSGLTFPIVYSSDPQVVNPDFTGPVQTLLFTTNGGNVPLEISGLQNNTTYYLTIMNTGGSIIINTDSNLSYESFTTGAQGGGNGTGGGSNGVTGSGVAGTININIDGTFGTSELQGENIEQGFTQCGYGDTYDCGFNELLATIDRIIKFMLYVVVLPLAAIMFAWSGIKLIIAKSQGKQAALSEAKSLFGQVLLGIVFAMGAWVIVKFILVILGYTDASGLLTQILGISTQ